MLREKNARAGRNARRWRRVRGRRLNHRRRAMKGQILTYSIALAMWVGTALPQRQSVPDTARSFGFLDGRVTVLQSATDTGGTSALLDLLIPANSGPQPHIHTREDELYVIKRGTFQFFMDGICRQAGPGAAFYMPKGHMHM